jgi:hypothetical protein
MPGVKLDFDNKKESGNYRVHSFHENFGYNLEKIIEKYPLAELKNESVKEALLQSLRKGNLQEVTWVLNECQNPVLLDRVVIMRVAKISSRDTYSRILLDLHRYGYVQYVPSFNCLLPSKVFIESLPVI